MNGKRWLAAAAVLAAAAALWWGAWRCLAPQPPQEQAKEPLWVLRDEGGLLAQYDWNAQADGPLRVWQVYTALLPEADAQRLREGIPVYSTEQLRQLIEDLGG